MSALTLAPLRVGLQSETRRRDLPPRRNPVDQPHFLRRRAEIATVHRFQRPAAKPFSDPSHAAGAIGLAVVDVLRGRRPFTHLLRWVSPALYDQLSEKAPSRLVLEGAALRLRRVRVQQAVATAVEATVVVEQGKRLRAVALRLEAHRGDWRATAITVG